MLIINQTVLKLYIFVLLYYALNEVQTTFSIYYLEICHSIRGFKFKI